MKKKLIFACIIIFIGYFLICPQDGVNAAAEGLVLWYEKVLPTLLPFVILSNLLIYSNYLQYITKYIKPIIRLFFPVSENGAFVIFSGFLFGFPMGSRNSSELLKHKKLIKNEADILFIITNNISPIFISSYILTQQLKMPGLIYISYLVLYLPPLLAGFYCLYKNSIQKSHASNKYHEELPQKIPASGSQMNFKIIDAGIMSGFETLTRIGGYIMLFSILANFIHKLPGHENLKLIATGIAEITIGIRSVALAEISNASKYILIMVLTAFGGISGIAQTSSMTKDTGLSIKKYALCKILFAIVSGLLAFLVARWYQI